LAKPTNVAGLATRELEAHGVTAKNPLQFQIGISICKQLQQLVIAAFAINKVTEFQQM
jgi:hypothetical protein